MDDVLFVFYENLSEIVSSFVVGRSKLANFMRQILNFIVTIILGRRKYITLGKATATRGR